jgi:hypothetical protein
VDNILVRHARDGSSTASAGASAGTPVTVWVKRMDVAGARYVAVKGVDLQETVDDFTARWVVEEGLTVRPSLVTLRLVACGLRKPSAAEEAAAVVLDDPRLSLAAVCVVDGCSLLAYVVGSTGALCLRSLRLFSYIGAHKENAGTLAQATGPGAVLRVDAPGACAAHARAP